MTVDYQIPSNGAPAGGSGGGLAGTVVKATGYTLLSTDTGYNVVADSGSAIQFLLPAAPPSATWFVFVTNEGAGALTINPNGLNINGAGTNLVAGQGQGGCITTDGANYFFSGTLIIAGTNVTVTGSPQGSTLSASVSGSGSFGGVVTQTSNYTAQSGDAGHVITFDIAALATLTLPGSPPASPWAISVQNQSRSTAILSVALSSSAGAQLDGEDQTLWINPGGGIQIFSDGSNYWTSQGVAGGQSDWWAFPYSLLGTDTASVTFTAGNIGGATNVTVMFPFYLDRPLRVKRMWYNVAAGDNSTNKYDLGIYSMDGTLLADCGAKAGTSFAPSTGLKNQLFVQGTVLLTPGKYFLGWTANGSSLTCGLSMLEPTAFQPVFLPANSSLTPAWYTGTASSGGALPGGTAVPAFSTSNPLYADTLGSVVIPMFALSGF